MPEQRKQLLPFAALSASYFAHIGFFNPYLPVWLKDLGFGLFAISVLTSVQSATRLFAPYAWGTLSDLMSSSGTMIMLVTYGTVIVQVAFPFTLFNRRVKNVLLAVMMTEHAVIAVVLGLPFFSLAMIAADAVFLPTPFLKRLGGLVARARDRVVRRVPPGNSRTIPGPRSPEQPPFSQDTQDTQDEPEKQEKGEKPEKGAADQPHVGFTA